MSSKRTLTYKSAGVDIDAGDELVERIKGPVARTLRPEVIGGLGGFGGLFRVPPGYKNPVLVAGTDGVGTKLRLAIEHDAHDNVGIDLVAMCVNDVVVQGAEPLFFLDYYATPRLDVDIAARVVAGIARGCELAGAALLGGETAEHPGMHAPGEYDLAGFCVGIVERDRIIDGSGIQAGDSLIGLASSGPHSNGFSLIRRVLESRDDVLDAMPGGRPLLEQLLAPTRIYVRPLLSLLSDVPLKGLAHITGGGLLENIPRVLPEGLGVRLNASSWPRPPVFAWLADAGIEPAEMYRTFNCGIGMILITAPEHAEAAIAHLQAAGERAYRIGTVVADPQRRVDIR
ncbi:MAG TPA: phosphoribosylformylglycinamidine cyclo-ligase [Gammaproteobacteria bacterium]|nr:phosphoribosylformylglycinamidine cyclo-ligase [Gammaproteobacteria bacterium]